MAKNVYKYEKSHVIYSYLYYSNAVEVEVELKDGLAWVNGRSYGIPYQWNFLRQGKFTVFIDTSILNHADTHCLRSNTPLSQFLSIGGNDITSLPHGQRMVMVEKLIGGGYLPNLGTQSTPSSIPSITRGRIFDMASTKTWKIEDGRVV